jgi:hypothetical protein
MNSKQKLQQWQPEAMNVCDAGDCHDCKQPTMLFYQLPGFNPIAPSFGYVQGGFWCSNCGWGNSGAMPKEDFAPEQYSETA